MNLSRIKLFAVLSALTMFSAMSFAESDLKRERNNNYSNNYNRGGCHVTFYDKKDFRGRRVTISGNRYFRDIDLKKAFGFKPESLIVGRRANLWLYDDEDYYDLEYYFRAGAGTRKIKSLNRIDSMVIRCI